MILPVGTIFGGNFGQFGQVARQLFLPNAAGNRADEETASTKTLALQAKVAQDRQTLLKELRLRALQFNDNRFQQQVRVGPFIFRINPYTDVFAAQVFVNDAFMCPVLIYEIQTAIGRLCEDDRLLKLRKRLQRRQYFCCGRRSNLSFIAFSRLSDMQSAATRTW